MGGECRRKRGRTKRREGRESERGGDMKSNANIERESSVFGMGRGLSVFFRLFINIPDICINKIFVACCCVLAQKLLFLWPLRPSAMVRFIGVFSTKAFQINLRYFGFLLKKKRWLFMGHHVVNGTRKQCKDQSLSKDFKDSFLHKL